MRSVSLPSRWLALLSAISVALVGSGAVQLLHLVGSEREVAHRAACGEVCGAHETDTTHDAHEHGQTPRSGHDPRDCGVCQTLATLGAPVASIPAPDAPREFVWLRVELADSLIPAPAPIPALAARPPPAARIA